MKVVQTLALGMGALLVAGGAWSAAWFVGPAVDRGTEAAPSPVGVSAKLDLDSDPPGTDAKTSLGWSCRTPCSIELLVEEPFTVTFEHRGFVSLTIPVAVVVEGPEKSEAKLLPDPIFARLQPLPDPRAQPEPARVSRNRAAPPKEVHEEKHDGLWAHGWQYIRQKTNTWQAAISKLVHFSF